jgi:hypothetical protein
VTAARRRFAAVVALIVCWLPGVALARRLATGSEKAAIISAVRRAHEIGPSQTAACMRVYVSTVNSNWATMQFVFTGRCAQQAANGVSVVHRTHGRWRFVTAGSAFSCPIPGHIPKRVQADLRLHCVPR